jgi:hypothetical protein
MNLEINTWKTRDPLWCELCNQCGDIPWEYLWYGPWEELCEQLGDQLKEQLDNQLRKDLYLHKTYI